MEKISAITSRVEKEKSRERGANVLVDIDLIRHPEKDTYTGELSEEGKEVFLQNLIKDFKEGEEYDTIKFYVSPLPRGQQSKEPITSFLEMSGVPTKIRDRVELISRTRDITPKFKEEITKILEERKMLDQEELQRVEQIEESRKKDGNYASYEPATKDFEIKANELLIKDYFNKNFPSVSFNGEDMARGIKDLIDHFAEMSSKLKSNSRVKLVLVGHSGIIEHFIKYIYLQNHPEVDPKDVDVETLGGLLKFGEGPRITIQTNQEGELKIGLEFKNLELEYQK